MTAADSGRRPLLAIGHGYRSVAPLQLAQAASDLCDIVWLVDGADPEIAAMGALLRKIGTVVDIGATSPASAAEALGRRPDGIIAYRDEDLAPLSALAEYLGIPFHSPEVAERLADKLVQRRALLQAGLSGPRIWELASSADARAVAAVAAQAVYPVVVKPRRGSGSWHTFLAEDSRRLVEVLEELQRDGAEGEEMVVEEYLASRSGAEDEGFADYVSVETVVSADTGAVHVAITGRTPLAEPFRETGFFLPAALGEDETHEVLATASAAVAALGLQTGCVHTEIKMTPAGPHVIEVNGRLGGGVPDMLALAAGVDLLELSMRVALGQTPELDGLFPCQSVGYRFFYQSPMSARRVLSVQGLDRVAALAGVESVFLHRGPGHEVDAREGTRAYIFSVVGSTADHAGVLEVDRFLKEAVEVTYAGAEDVEGDPTSTAAGGVSGASPSTRARDHRRKEVGHAGPLRTVG